MTINGRLVLLVVATGLFVRVWMANERPRVRNRVTTRSQATCWMPPPDPAPRAAAAPARSEEVVVRPAAVATKAASAAEETWTEYDCPIPLPAGIGSGIYRVVDETGRVARLEIDPSRFADQLIGTVASPTDFLMTTH